MFDDARLEKLENLYDKYDSAITKSEKRLALKEILEIDPTDIDSMHRLVDLLPEKQQLDALLKLLPKLAFKKYFKEQNKE